MISLVVGILSGAAPPLSKVEQWHLEWLWRLSPGTWVAEVYFGQLVEPFRVWLNLAVLLLIGTVYRLLAFVGLLAGTRLRL
ncbi:hypothetical protein ONZ43_g6514 [Nemania bipapillata]|uniref:Uncharacterized protein n=1 Tax=Nemania bipapillata TaxID=110536 RepID=A0ACC2HZ29_9PEZI|nr:hypothetical protein ONZ43_g6514 [Nemania bipapillata]